jgi:hypothetical protein
MPVILTQYYFPFDFDLSMISRTQALSESQ